MNDMMYYLQLLQTYDKYETIFAFSCISAFVFIVSIMIILVMRSEFNNRSKFIFLLVFCLTSLLWAIYFIVEYGKKMDKIESTIITNEDIETKCKALGNYILTKRMKISNLNFSVFFMQNCVKYQQ